MERLQHEESQPGDPDRLGRQSGHQYKHIYAKMALNCMEKPAASKAENTEGMSRK